MYDFCFGFPFAGVLFLGGLVGYAKAGSRISLLAGVGCGSTIAFLAKSSMDAHKRGEGKNVNTLVGEIALSTALAAAMYKRHQSSGKFMPSGFLALASGAMAVIYTWCLTLGPA